MNICVFCSSSNNIDNLYIEDAFRLGELIAQSGNTLVYGGATGGLMSAVAEGACSKNGEIIGVIARPIIRMNRQSNIPTQLIVTEDMSERKKVMKQQSDLFVVLPGGYGTLDEMFDIVASGTVGEHKKPLILINKNDFFHHFLEQITLMKNERCIPENESYKIKVVQDTDECMKHIINPKISL